MDSVLAFILKSLRRLAEVVTLHRRNGRKSEMTQSSLILDHAWMEVTLVVTKLWRKLCGAVGLPVSVEWETCSECLCKGAERPARDGRGTPDTRAEGGGRNGPISGEGPHPEHAGYWSFSHQDDALFTNKSSWQAAVLCCRDACSNAAQTAAVVPLTPWLRCISVSRSVTLLWPRLRGWSPQSWRSFRWGPAAPIPSSTTTTGLQRNSRLLLEG